MTDPITPTSPDALARLAARQAYGALPDRVLLERFATDRDEAAFAALVERHGAVVLDAARAVVRLEQDAEDVFQATFLVLARKAGTIRKRDALGCWLHGVARRIALKAVRARTRRTRHESAPHPRPQPIAGDELTWAEIRAIVHDEIARLPEALRAPVLLCHFQGLTLDEASDRLELPRGTLRGRLDRAREVLRRRLGRRGLALTALAFPASIARAVDPMTVLATARVAARFATGVAEPNRATALAKGAMSMTPTYVKLALLVAVSLGIIGVGVAETRNREAPAPEKPALRDPGQQFTAAPLPGESPKAEFQEMTIVIKHSFMSNRTRETIKVSADGTCLYEVPERPARGKIPAWTGAKIIHKISPDRLWELNNHLKATNWLKNDAKAVMQLHQLEYDLTVKRDGKSTDLSIKGESKGYAKLLSFFHSLADQEYLIYRLEWVPAAMIEGRQDLDNLVLEASSARSAAAIDLHRYIPWAKRLVRNPFEKQADDVKAAVRLVGYLRLESEREYLADLANDRNWNVREAVAVAIGRLGGEKAIPVLRKLCRSTGRDAAWELIKLGEPAVPTIAAVIHNGEGEEDMSYESLIRTYIEHWKVVPKPLDSRILDAVRANMDSPKVKAFRTQYHGELLKLAADTKK